MDLQFNIVGSGYSAINARSCAAAARLAYTELPTVSSPLNHVLVIDCPEARVIAFRGTADPRDLITDAEVFFAATVAGNVHWGFQHAFISILEPLLAWLRDHPSDLPVFVTGHSLGGAQAVLFAYYAFPELNLRGLYTFGQPRVGDARFALACSVRFSSHFRIVNEEDIVPRLPGWLAGYRHSGQHVFFPSIGGMSFNPPWWKLLISDAWGTYLDWRRGQIAQLADHHIDRYLQRLA